MSYREFRPLDFNIIRWERERGASGRLRRDLESLLGYFGDPDLRSALRRCGISRALEVGPGLRIDGLEQLATLSDTNGPLFSAENLYAAEPNIFCLEVIQASRDKEILEKVTWLPLCVEDVAGEVLSRKIMPFDLVLARGVVSNGGLQYINSYSRLKEGTRERMIEDLNKAFEIISAMANCLSDKPNALIVLDTVTDCSCLPFTRSKLEELGLEVVFSEKSNESGRTIFSAYQKAGIYRQDYQEVFDLVICRKVQSP